MPERLLVVVKSGGAAAMPEWRAAFAAALPEAEVRMWGEPGIDAAAVTHALVWEPEAGVLASFPNLRLVISTGAGVDHVLADADYPRHVPLARMILPETCEGMAEFVGMSALMLMRDMRTIARQQAERHWRIPPDMPLARRTRVGVLGLGALGLYAARYLATLGFQTSGWSRSPKTIAGVTTSHGMAQLPAFLAECDILVNLLPQTPDTVGLLDRARLSLLPQGASVLNVGRAAHVVTADLLALLDTGHLSTAMLDVFDTEPLPKDSPLWDHPRVVVTPHCASTPSRTDRAHRAATLIRLAEAGEPVPDLYEAARGY
ncbi:2-hydroxyacid dehydrogenase [Cupriavidus plantarum]|uniref:2-hydroxyacid dehydrogenase n=1 Tax=Cupriavidus plantarum TaxID=942865 RepID=UPI000E3A3D6C|nr:glyoxylate/hydroxypyruvate reductase A [Cupriavidus plantarum]REE87663.1 glyoxylate/hydroxypyruvate reductase A [Cupriavidus plantarum]